MVTATKVSRVKVVEDPRPRKDGRCFVCRGERPEVAVKMEDAFCSTGCARIYFKTDEAGKSAA